MKKESELFPLLHSTESNSSVSFTKGTLAWSNISAESSKFSFFSQISNSSRESSKKKEKPRLILNNLSGIARPGEVLAIMGTSGVGKSFI